MKNSGQSNLTRRREPLTDTQLLLTITICIFVCMYVLAMIIWGGGFRKPQMLFDILNDNAYLVIISCGLTIVMITGSIDISVGGVVALVAMVGVMILNGNLSFFNNLIASLGLSESWRIVFAALMALLIGLAFGLVQGFLIANLEIQPFIITLAGMFFARGMITIVSVDPQKAPQNLMDILQTRIDIPWSDLRRAQRHCRLRLYDAYRSGQCDQCNCGRNERHCLFHYRRNSADRRRRQCHRHFLRRPDPEHNQIHCNDIRPA